MSTENQNEDERTQEVSIEAAQGTNVAAEKTEKEHIPMPFKQKVCLSISFLGVAIAIMNISGLLTELPTLLALALKEQPVGLLFITAALTALTTIIISSFVPRKIDVLGRAPAFLFIAFWLNYVWGLLIENYSTSVSHTGVVWVVVATAILGFCVAYHDKGSAENPNPSLSGRIEYGLWMMVIANIFAFVLSMMIVVGFIGSIKDNVQSKIDNEVDRHRLLDQLYGICHVVQPTEYCDAFKIVTSQKP
jgi:uncharacterized membrane protein